MEFLDDVYRDRVMGCWAGKCLAGTIGMPFEGVPYEPSLTPETIYVQDVPNDDLELQLVWLIAMESIWQFLLSIVQKVGQHFTICSKMVIVN